MKLATGLFIVLCGLAPAACVDTSGVPNFERMSEAELAAYNRDRPIAQMIVCGDEDRAFSRVRRRQCMTVEQMYGSVEQASELDVLNSVPGYVQPAGTF